MKFRVTIVLAFVFISQLIYSQSRNSVIKSNSKVVDIKDDNKLRKNAWTIAPEENPDVYKTSAKKVTFYTDIDSITINVTPNVAQDFTILLKGKDSAKTRVVYVPSKLDILKGAENYNFNDNRFVPKFSYQSENNSNLIKIRKDLNLDSIAGKGNELSKIFNLLHWVHNIVRHDGSSNNPTLKNAIDLINICQKENRGLNCRMLATILNECYLSIGIKSRYVTCMPKETDFDDCHVINMVFSKDLDKWIWIDPTFDAYVMDDEGNLLGISEVRDRLIKGLPLVLNADANWNRESLQTKEYYLEYYMAKNLYRLKTPIVSEFNSETWKKETEIKYVELLPLDGIEQEPQKTEFFNKEIGVKFLNYKTNNPAIFWAKP